MGQWRPAADPTVAWRQVTQWLAATDPAPVVINTSGSTGKPKQVVLTRAAVVASARATLDQLGPGRWALGLPTQHVAGLQVLVRSALQGTEPVSLRGAGPVSLQGAGPVSLQGAGPVSLQGAGPVSLEALPDEPVHVSIVSTQLVRWVQDPPDWSRFATILLGGGPVAQQARAAAEAQGARIVATYGMTETAGGCVYDGRPLPGYAVRVAASGQIALAGPSLAAGYLVDDGSATQDALVTEEFAHGWFVTSDLGEVAADGTLRVLGRRDDMIISGGVKVPAGAVATRLSEHPDAGEVAVLGAADPEWGQQVVAFVTGSVSLAELRAWASETLPRSWAPKRVVRLSELPRLASGKVDRTALEEELA